MTWRWLLLGLLFSTSATAHVGSPDVTFDGMASPYPVLVLVRPPMVIPGTAQVEVRIATPGVRAVKLLPMPLSGAETRFPPTADLATRSPADGNLFTGQLWLMSFGSWQVRIHVEGDRGEGAVSVPVAALATQTRGMDQSLGRVLIGLMIFLVFGLVSIAGAAVRESTLAAGVESPSAFRPKSLMAMLATTALAVGALYAGGAWWGSEAASYSRKLYKPLDLHATVRPDHQLLLQLSDPGWLAFRKLDDLVPDHGHLMHLYALREPGMDAVFHLHPEMVQAGAFELALPPMAPGRYKLFADIVHAGGLGETPITEIEIADAGGTPLSGDNSGGIVNPGATMSLLPDGNRMIWVRAGQPIHAQAVQRFVFRIEDAAGKALTDLEPYMGMAGHAAFVRHDFSTFAHVHPTGSAPMPALMMAAAEAAPDSMAAMHQVPRAAEVSFPYAFPAAGRYRVIVQMKRAGKIQTGAFDVEVL